MPRGFRKNRFFKSWERFQAGWLEDSSGCHIWQRCKDKDGYGKFVIKGVTTRAHRAVWWFHHEGLPSDLVINHKCRNRACVNIDHLEMISSLENLRKDSNHWAMRTTCLYGHPWDRVFYNKKRGDWVRLCSICKNANSRKNRAKRKAEGRRST